MIATLEVTERSEVSYNAGQKGPSQRKRGQPESCPLGLCQGLDKVVNFGIIYIIDFPKNDYHSIIL